MLESETPPYILLVCTVHSLGCTKCQPKGFGTPGLAYSMLVCVLPCRRFTKHWFLGSGTHGLVCSLEYDTLSNVYQVPQVLAQSVVCIQCLVEGFPSVGCLGSGTPSLVCSLECNTLSNVYQVPQVLAQSLVACNAL